MLMERRLRTVDDIKNLTRLRRDAVRIRRGFYGLEAHAAELMYLNVDMPSLVEKDLTGQPWLRAARMMITQAIYRLRVEKHGVESLLATYPVQAQPAEGHSFVLNLQGGKMQWESVKNLQ